MSKKYVLIIRDKICMFSPVTDSILEAYKCYYKSPEFLWDGTLVSLDIIICGYQKKFSHFIDWTAQVVPV